MTTCSRCTFRKDDNSGWWFMWTERQGQRLCIMPWETDPDLALESSVLKLCGVGCLAVELARWAGKTSVHKVMA